MHDKIIDLEFLIYEQLNAIYLYIIRLVGIGIQRPGSLPCFTSFQPSVSDKKLEWEFYIYFAEQVSIFTHDKPSIRQSSITLVLVMQPPTQEMVKLKKVGRDY